MVERRQLDDRLRASGYVESGKNVAEKRNIGSTARFRMSKSCQLRMYVTAAMPEPANANR